jgi:MoxR-like ATPase
MRVRTSPGSSVAELGRAIAGILQASGRFTDAEVERANAALSALGRLPLADNDFVLATPEQLAPTVPVELRAVMLELFTELAGDEPIRRRIAEAYARLWGDESIPAAKPRRGPAVLRWLIGGLPRHQLDLHEENAVQDAPYRHEPQAAPVERSPLRLRVEHIREQYLAVVDAVESVIIGKRDVIERVVTAIAARGHVLIVDIPGVGKTQLCKAIAAAIQTSFGRIQFTPDLLPMDITGANIFDAKDRELRFRPGPVFTHVLLADEINRATPKTQSALLEVMEERCVTVDGVTHQLAEPFQVLATMNPLDHQGTYALPAAQIDRFMVMLEVGLPTPEDEVKVLDVHLGATPPLASVKAVISRADLIAWRETVPFIHVTPELKRTVVEYVTKLRRAGGDGQSLSPRATLAWVRAGQARAMLAGREFVTIDDVLDVAPDVLRHRLWTDTMTVRERLRAVAIGVR